MTGTHIFIALVITAPLLSALFFCCLITGARADDAGADDAEREGVGSHERSNA